MADSGSPDDINKNNKTNKNPAPADNTRRREDDENPFVAFRRYADEQVSSLLRSVIGLPSLFTPPSTRDWMSFREEDRSRQYQRRRQDAEEGSGEQSSNSSWSGYRGSSEGFSNSHQNEAQGRRRALVPLIFGSALDDFWPFDPSPSFGGFSHFHPPFFFDFLASFDSIGWPFSYLMFSPYSPLHLEHQQRLRQRADRAFFAHPVDYLFRSVESLGLPGEYAREREEEEDAKAIQWRIAFEDLLRIENGQPMLERWTDLPKRESPDSWFTSMIARGSLGDNWKHVKRYDGDSGYFTHGNGSIRKRLTDAIAEAEKTSEGRDKLTELDLYDAFLRQVGGSEEDDDVAFPMSPILSAIFAEQRRNRKELEEYRKKWAELQSQMDDVCDDVVDIYDRDTNVAPVESDQKPPPVPTRVRPDEEPSKSGLSIVSTMTSVNRRTLPDGSIETKTVRTKRFADGSEESNETVHVQNPDREITTTNEKPDVRGGPDTGSTTPTSGDKENPRAGWFWKD